MDSVVEANHDMKFADLVGLDQRFEKLGVYDFYFAPSCSLYIPQFTRVIDKKKR